MKLKNKNLVEQLAADSNNPKKKNDFPKSNIGENYSILFQAFSQQLDTQIHRFVTESANVVDGGALTSHGPDHIKRVIERASDLVAASSCNLSPYEIYILLMAIHIHDIGNIFGREAHEEKSADILAEISRGGTFDKTELRHIQRIAQAHGGNFHGDKDTIRQLSKTETLNSKQVRMQLIAAVVRLADELAEDKTRANLPLLKAGKLGPAEVFHKFASGLHTVFIDHAYHQVQLRFDFDKEDFTQTFQKGDKQVYLLDEIFSRTTKMFGELQYTSAFIREAIWLDNIDVNISINQPEGFSIPFETIPYRLVARGYPIKLDPIHELAIELKDWKGGGILTGERFAKLLSGSDQGEVGK